MIILVILFLISFFIFIYITNILSDNKIIDFLLKDADNYCANMTIHDLRARKCNNSKEYIHTVVNEHKSSNNGLNIKDIIILLCACIRADVYFYNLESKLIPSDNNIYKVLWNFAFMKSDSYEDKYPHTRLDIIFIHINILKKIYNLNDFYNFVGLLIHEKLHIYQRYNSIKFDVLLQKHHINRKHLRKHFKLVRANPDLNDWIYNNGDNLMMATYNSAHPTSINDVSMKTEYEHPYEMISYLIENKYKNGD
tara:strand:+ start:283 stop:1038 length:756 start_codon:yes stop_codon:yes gene_type:complete